MTTSDGTTVELPADVAAAAQARRAVEPLAAGDPTLEQHLKLLTTELVTNSLRHGGLREDDHIELRATRVGDAVRVEVHDPGRTGRAPRIRYDDGGLRGKGGLGLQLVAKVADSWGAERVPGDGTRAWFEVAA